MLGHHLIQSFYSEDNLTPEQIHEIGRQTILEFTGGEYEFVITTHVDRKHIHNHIILLESRQEKGNVPTPPPSATQSNQKQSSSSDSYDPFANSEPMNIQDDDLPF